jgi:predicted nucleic acid-binding protein
VTVLDTSAVIDYLLGSGAARAVRKLLRDDSPTAAPDLLVFEVLAVLRRDVGRGDLGASRARLALADLGDAAIELFPTLALRGRAFELRENLTAADALFVALAEALGEPLATKDEALARAARRHTDVEVFLVS